MTVFAAMLLEDVVCQFVGAHLRHLRVGQGLCGRS
jgi:hypothetical protein